MKRKAKSQATHSGLAVVNPNAAAIDIGATIHVAAVGADRASDPVRSFGTFTADLHRLADWFAECGVKTVVMESTSVYWIPIFELLDERGFEVILVNARDAKHVPGRKTDVSDAQWLQRLHSYGRGVRQAQIRGAAAAPANRAADSWRALRAVWASARRAVGRPGSRD
jgi:transposase